MGNLWLLILLLIAMAAVLNDSTLLMPAFLLASALLLSLWWSRRVLKSIRFGRTMADRAFLNDKVTVQVELVNTSLLPVVWLRIHDSLPPELGPHAFDHAVSLKPRERRRFEYVIQANKRGFYRIGPLWLQSGDVLGLGKTARAESAEIATLVVYPKIVLLEPLQLPSQMPIGALRHRQPIFEDPSLMRGKRDYAVGDSLRRVDWKASGAVGRLQVKLCEPSVSLETMIFLDLNVDGYERMTWIDSSELAIVVAASVGNWLVERKQAVGLATNGQALSLEGEGSAHSPHTVPPRKGRGHFMRLLDLLARAKATHGEPISSLIRREHGRFAWGTTLIVITGSADDALFDELFRAQRVGLNVMLVLCGHNVHFEPIRRRAAGFGIRAFHIRAEREVGLLAG
jgi:uncharacterized protein (DUF58 family)